MSQSPDNADDPVLEAEIERALGPYRDLLPPEILEQLRATLADALTTHPVGAALLDRTRPAPQVDQSGEVDKDAGGEGEPASSGKAASRG